MRIHSTTRNTLIGGGVVLMLAGAFLFSYGAKSLNGAFGTYPVTAVFNRVDGLFEGDVVRMSGIPIGTVGAERLNKNYRAVVTLNINAGVKIPLDTAAAINTDGLFGSKFVVLEPGGDDKVLTSGDVIQYTQGSMIVSDLLGMIIDEGRARQSAPKHSQKLPHTLPKKGQ